MTRYDKKRRSFVAGLISFVGSLVMLWGLYLVLSQIFSMVIKSGGSVALIILGILILILSAIIQYGSIMYDKYREHKKWVARLCDSGIADELASSKELAWQAYRSNPTPMGLRFIEEYNPKAASEIKKHVALTQVSPVEKAFGDIFSGFSEKKPAEKPKKQTASSRTSAQEKEKESKFDTQRLSDTAVKAFKTVSSSAHKAAEKLSADAKSVISSVKEKSENSTHEDTIAEDNTSEK